MTCEICTAIKDESRQQEVLYETSHWIVSLASKQAYLGRCYVSLKRHCGDLAELTDDELLNFRDVARTMEDSFRRAVDATMFNWTCLMNDAYQVTPPEPHVHWHLRPRYNHDITVEGFVFRDPEFGHHYDREREKESDVSPEVRAAIINRIRENMQS